jgi:hypothetical protein
MRFLTGLLVLGIAIGLSPIALAHVTVKTDGSFHVIAPNSWGTPHSPIGNHFMFTGREFTRRQVSTSIGPGTTIR